MLRLTENLWVPTPDEINVPKYSIGARAGNETRYLVLIDYEIISLTGIQRHTRFGRCVRYSTMIE